MCSGSGTSDWQGHPLTIKYGDDSPPVTHWRAATDREGRLSDPHRHASPAPHSADRQGGGLVRKRGHLRGPRRASLLTFGQLQQHTDVHCPQPAGGTFNTNPTSQLKRETLEPQHTERAERKPKGYALTHHHRTSLWYGGNGERFVSYTQTGQRELTPPTVLRFTDCLF